MSSDRWSLEEISSNVHILDTWKVTNDQDFWCLVLSDIHWDNPKTDLVLFKRHMDEALEHDAPIIIIGDFFCAMQGKYDRRSNKSDVRPEHQSGEYLDRLVETASKWLEPYKNNLAILGAGNHETKILEYHETNLLDRLAADLRKKGGITRCGGYSGYVRFRIPTYGTSRMTKDLWYMHGHGGGGPVTKGMIDANRYQMWVDADVICAGHVHYQNMDVSVRMHLGQTGKISYKNVLFLRCGTYKEEYRGGKGGFHVEKGRGPRPLGGWWLRFHTIDANNKIVAITEQRAS